MTPQFYLTLLSITIFTTYLTTILISDIRLERREIARHKYLLQEDKERNEYIASSL